MLLATHSIVAATAGESIGSPALALFAGIVIHFLLDAIPHFDTTDRGKLTSRQIILIATDGLIGLGLFYFIYRRSVHPTALVWGGIGGVLPDFVFNIPIVSSRMIKYKPYKYFYDFHIAIQRINLLPVPGILIQIILTALALYLNSVL